jgi:hypothetical protein
MFDLEKGQLLGGYEWTAILTSFKKKPLFGHQQFTCDRYQFIAKGLGQSTIVA